MTRDSFDNRLREALRLNNMKATELSAKSGVSEAAISHYLHGDYKASQRNLTKLAKALNVNEAWLLGLIVSKERVELETYDIEGNIQRETLESFIKDFSTDELDKLIEYASFIYSKRGK